MQERITQRKRCAAALLAAALLLAALLSACGGDPPAGSAAAMGRYTETQINTPDDLTYLLYTHWQGGDGITLYGMTQEEANIFVWESQDGGSSWLRDETPLLDEALASTLSWIPSFTMDENGVPYMVCYTQNEASPAVMMRREEDGWKVINENLAFSGATGENVKILPGGYYAVGYYYWLALYRGDGSVVNSFDATDRMKTGSYIALDDCFAYGDGNTLYLVSLETGQPLRDIPIQGPSNSVNSDFIQNTEPQTMYCWDGETNSICYANNTGIYQTDREGALTEKIVDGALTSLSLPSVIITTLQYQNGSFLVEAADEESRPFLYRYDYNAQAPTVPNVQLRLYALEDWPSVRQAIGVFQQSHPDVMVKYEVGLPGDDSVTRQDALKALATRILADDAPDILVLDGLDWESYGEKGVLLNLQDIAQGEEENYYSPVLNAFNREGACYALPTRFQLPLLLSASNAVSQTQTPSALADFLAAQDNPRINQQADAAFRTMGKYYAPRWFNEDGSFNPVAYSEDLTAFGKIQSQLAGLETEAVDAGRDYSIVSLLYGEGSCVLSLESLFALKSLPSISTALDKRDGVLSLYPSSKKYFEPKLLMGISAASNHSDLAQEFIRCALSYDAQLFDLGDGLPVNRAAMEQNVSFRDTGDLYWTFGFEGYSPESDGNEFYIVMTETPSETFIRNLHAILEAMETPLYMDEDVLSLLLEKGAQHLEGESTLEQTLSDIEQELLLRAAE